MAQTVLQPLSNGLYTSGKGVGHFYAFADPFDPSTATPGVRVGDMNSAQVNVSVDKSTIESNEYDVATDVAERVNKISVEVTLELKQLSQLVQAASVMGKVDTFSQDAQSGLTLDVTEPGVYRLEGSAPSNITAVNGAGDPLSVGTDYMIDNAGGQIQIIASGAVTVTYDLPAVTEQFATGIASSTGIRGAFTLTGTNSDGVRTVLVIHDVELTPSSAREFISSGSDTQTVTLTGKAYPVAGKAAGYEIGYIKEV